MKFNHKTAEVIQPSHAANLMPDDVVSKKILKNRANIYNKTEATISEEIKQVEYIRFQLGDNEYYGIPYQWAIEVIDHIIPTPVPNVIHAVAGVINRRGKLLVLLDLKHFFQLSNLSASTKPHLIVVAANGMEFGILADHIHGSDSYDPKKLSTAPPYAGVIDSQYIIGLHHGITAILNIEAVLAKLQTLLKQIPH